MLQSENLTVPWQSCPCGHTPPFVFPGTLLSDERPLARAHAGREGTCLLSEQHARSDSIHMLITHKWSHQRETISSEQKCVINEIWCNQRRKGRFLQRAQKWRCFFKKGRRRRKKKKRPSAGCVLVQQKQPMGACNLKPEACLRGPHTDLRAETHPVYSWFRQAESHILLSAHSVQTLMQPKKKPTTHTHTDSSVPTISTANVLLICARKHSTNLLVWIHWEILKGRILRVFSRSRDLWDPKSSAVASLRPGHTSQNIFCSVTLTRAQS